MLDNFAILYYNIYSKIYINTELIMHNVTIKGGRAAAKQEKLMQILSLVLSAVIIITAIVLAVACVHLYKTGTDQPYTRERAIAYLTALLPVTLICLVSVIALGILSLIYPTECRTASHLSPKRALAITYTRLGTTARSDELLATEGKEKKVRFTWLVSCIATAAVLFGAVLIFAFTDTSKYTVEACTEQAAILAIVALAAFLLTGALMFVALNAIDRSFNRELEAARAFLAAVRKEGKLAERDGSAELSKNSGHLMYIVRGAVLICAVVLIILGISNGSMNDVLGKAVQICTECIGLG